MKKFKIFDDIIILNTTDETIQVNNNNPITFAYMDELVKECAHINRMHKPAALLLYTDYKNGKISKYKEMEVN